MIQNPKLDADRILLVNDDLDDIDLPHRAMESQKFALKLEVIENGEDALKYLRGEDPYTNRIPPNLVLLDLNLPFIKEKEVLKELRDNENISIRGKHQECL